ncbi:MAG: gamma carbonic anhydrase family protein [Desulfurococcales archaeon]|nr:gamma carbonic anhydrase family protein [Desulfurococcales archaeon]
MNAGNIFSFNGKTPRIHPTAFIDPSARIVGDVTIEENVGILYGTIIRGDDDRIDIGKSSVVLENSLVEAPPGKPVSIRENSLVSHGAIIHGAIVGDCSLVGIGAIVLDGAVIGEESIIAAGALIPPGKIIPRRSLVIGIPGKTIRNITDEDLEVVKKELEAVHRKIPVYKRLFSNRRDKCND